MQFKSALEKRNLQTTNLPVAQQKKIADLLKLKEQVEEAEKDVADDAEEQEQINEAKEQIAEVDQELASFIESFDLEKYEKKKQSAAAIREKRLSKIKNKEQHQEEPQPEPKPEPKPQPKPQEPVKQPEPPIYENETSIVQTIKEQEQEQEQDDDEICEDCADRLVLAKKMEKQGFRPKQIWLETGYIFQEGKWHFDEDWEERRYEPVPVYNEFEKVAEVKKKPKNYSLWVIGIGALILTVGAVNLFKERK